MREKHYWTNVLEQKRGDGEGAHKKRVAVTRSVGGSSIMFGKNDSAGTQMQVENEYSLW